MRRWPTNPLLGFISKTVQFQGKLFTVIFLQATVAGPILGIDFLRKFRITVAETSQVLFASMAIPFHEQHKKSLILSLTTSSIYFKKFPSILGTGDVMPTPTHGVGHHIHTGSHPPVFAKSRHLDPENFEIAKAEFKLLESTGIFQRSKSPWASPLHMVTKKDGSR